MVKFFLLGILGMMCCIVLPAQTGDTVLVNKDSIVVNSAPLTNYDKVLDNLLSRHRDLSVKQSPEIMLSQPKKATGNNTIFYILSVLLLLLGCLKFFYEKYFNNLVKVFFHTTIRQNQLTDQLIQAKLPSLFYTLFYVLSGGVYITLIVEYFRLSDTGNYWAILGSSVFFLALVYLVKYLVLKFTGWLTGITLTTDIYIFVIFLFNKMMGIFLVPISIAIAFFHPSTTKSIVVMSLMFIGLMFLFRFFRSYGLVQNQLKISRFHFFLYLIGLEILPLLMVYKGLALFLSKNT